MSENCKKVVKVCNFFFNTLSVPGKEIDQIVSVRKTNTLKMESKLSIYLYHRIFLNVNSIAFNFLSCCLFKLMFMNIEFFNLLVCS